MTRDILRQLSEHLDDNIPDDVLDSPTWHHRLMASPDNLLNLSSTFDDLVEDSEYMDGDYEEYD